MKLAINLATRGRPELVVETVRRTLENVRNLSTQLMISCDSDDEATIAALRDRYINDPAWPVFTDIREREDSLGAKFNRVTEVIPDADLYMIAVDDGPHITPGFDEKIIAAAGLVPDGYCVIMNHLENLSFPSIQAVSAKFVQRMGHLWPTRWPYWFGDHWIDDVARMTGRFIFVDILTDRSTLPPTQERRDIDFWAEVFNRTAPERERQARSIIHSKDFLIPRWHKELLCNNFPIVRERSVILNAIAVQTTMSSESAPDSERHQRLRAAAEAEVGSIPRRQAAPHVGNGHSHPLSVVVATPVLEDYTPEYRHSWSATEIELARNGIPFNHIEGKGCQFIDNARNVLASMFLKGSTAENFLMVDADLGWPAEKVIEFSRRPEPVVVGAYRKKSDELSIPVDFVIKDGQLVERDGLLQVIRAPSGFMRIKRWVLQKFYDECEKYVEPIAGGSIIEVSRIFRTGIEDHPQGRRFHGEDILFCKMLQEAGIEMWVDPDITFAHVGRKVWGLNVKEILPQLREGATKLPEGSVIMTVGT